MANLPLNPEPLKYGELAPDFALPCTDGGSKKRDEFRRQQAVVLIFLQPTPEAVQLLQLVSADCDEYKALNAAILGIAPASLDQLNAFSEANTLSISLLSDQEGSVWRAYVQTDCSGYGVFVLDVYGGVDSQRVAASVSELPAAPKILEWMRGAQYRCSI